MGRLVFRIDELPDLSLNKYQSLSDTGIEGVLKRHSDFLRQWYGICLETDTSFHLLYYFSGKEKQGHRLQLYFFLQGDDENLQRIEPLIQGSPLGDFYRFRKSPLP